METSDRDAVGRLVLNRATNSAAVSSGRTIRLWTAFSGEAFHRKIFNAILCGGGPLHLRRGCTDADEDDGAVVRATTRRAGSAVFRSHGSKSIRADGRSQKLSDLLKPSEPPDEGSEGAEIERKLKNEVLEELKGVVGVFQSQEMGDQKEGAMRVRSLAKENSQARTTLAMLGAIPPLVRLLDSEDPGILTESLYALLNLGIGNDLNKAAIVKAGSVHKMLSLIESSTGSPDVAIAEAIVGNFLSLTALDSNKPIIGSSGAIPFLVRILQNSDNRSGQQARQDAFRALYNLSICHSNVSQILETDLIPFLLNSLGDMQCSERILMILSNVVSVPEGRRGVSCVPNAFPILIDVFNWNDSPKCQEKACYVLMVMAHKSYGDRQAMIEAGIVSQLLELTLLGSTLAQKRASRILECLTVGKGKQVSDYCGGTMGGNVSAPVTGASSSSANSQGGMKDDLEVDECMMSEERRAVKELVQQSLQNNMKRIVKRANLPQDFVPSEHLKSLTSTSTSKSLPF